MRWILQFFLAHLNLTSFILTVSMSLYMLQAPLAVQKKIESLLNVTIFLPINMTVSETISIRNNAKENEKLHAEKAQLLIKISQLQSELQIRKISKSPTLFQEHFGFNLVGANVVARDVSHLYRSLVLDKGSSSGIRKNMPVVTSSGVVGKVVSVLPHASMVALLRSPDEYTSVLHPASNTVALMKVGSDGQLYAKFRKQSQVVLHDTLYTSGMGGVYPEYLPVGVVSEIVMTQNTDMFKQVKVDPTVNFETMRYAYVITLDSQWESYLEEIDSLQEEMIQHEN